MPSQAGYFCEQKGKDGKKCDLCQFAKLPLANGVLLRKKLKDGAKTIYAKLSKMPSERRYFCGQKEKIMEQKINI